MEEIFAEIDEIDIDSIEVHPDVLEYFKTVEAYLYCFDHLQVVYDEVDPSHKLANYDMTDVKLPIQQLSKNGTPVKNLMELYEVAKIMLPIFIDKMEGLMERAASNASRVQSHYSAHLSLPSGENKLKAIQRASEKAKDDYLEKDPGPPESWLHDIVRGSVLFDDADQLLEFLEIVCGDESIEIVQSTNRFRNPALSGYRDWNLQLQISTTDGRIKHICELQLHLRVIKEEDTKLGSHGYYEFFRKYYAGGTGSLEEQLNLLRMICQGGCLNKEFLNNVIQNPLEVDCMVRLADLFEHHVNHHQLAIIITNVIREHLEPIDLYSPLGRLFEKRGELEEATVLYHEVLGMRLKKLGLEHPKTAETYSSLAIVYRKQGRLQDSLMLNKRALDIRLKVLGSDHVDTAESYNNIALVLNDDDDLEEALAMHQNSLDIRLKVLGPDHSDTAQSYENMANVLDDQGKLDEAIELFERALSIQLKALGPDHTHTSTTYNNMAVVLDRQGKATEAMKLYENALKIRLIRLGPYHIDTAQTLKNIAVVLQNEGKLEEAMKLYQRVFAIQLKVLEPDHPDTGHTYNNMGHTLYKQGELEEAMRLHLKALKIRVHSLGPDHTETSESYNNIAIVLHSQSEVKQAMELYQKALAIRLKALGPDHIDTATTYLGMAAVLESQGKLEEAIA